MQIKFAITGWSSYYDDQTRIEGNLALSDFIKTKRIDNFLTQQEAAVLLGYKKSQFLSNLECGKRKPPLDVLKKMCEVYHVEQAQMRDEYINSARDEAHQLAQDKWDSQT